MKGTLRTAAFGDIYPETAHFRRIRSLGIGTRADIWFAGQEGCREGNSQTGTLAGSTVGLWLAGAAARQIRTASRTIAAANGSMNTTTMGP
jgi:hypothetical protein